MAANIHATIFQKLVKLGILDDHYGVPAFAEHVKLVSKPYMDLSVDRLGNETIRCTDTVSVQAIRISLAHNYEQNGDLMADPDMEIRIFPAARMAEALTYQQDGLGIYQVVYPEPDKVYPKLKKDLNKFLNQWLSNLIAQGFYLPQKPEHIEPPKRTPIPYMTDDQVLNYRAECAQNRQAYGIDVPVLPAYINPDMIPVLDEVPA